MGKHRLVTVVGTVGSGKTRLATEVADALNYTDGIWFVDLAAVGNGDRVDQVIADTVQAPCTDESPMLTTLATIEMWCGHSDESVRLLRRALEIEQTLDRPARLASTHAALGEVLTTTGDLEDARHHTSAALDLIRRLDQPVGLSNVLATSAHLALRTGDLYAALAFARDDHDAAEHAYAESLRACPENPEQVPYGLGGLAMVAISRGDDERGGLRLARSTSSIQRAAGVRFAAHLQDQVDEAVATATRRLGSCRFRPLTLAQAVDYALRGVLPAGSPLNVREYEIARLVAKGQTDRQIGRQLGLSARSISAALEEIRGKLGLGSRAELAAWITRHDG